MEKIANKSPEQLALEKLDKNGYLGMTIKDLKTIDPKLIFNILGLDDPMSYDNLRENIIENSDTNKTLGELLNDEQINIYIEKNQNFIKTHEYPYPDPEEGVPYRERLTGMTASRIRRDIESLVNEQKKRLDNSINYLKSIKRLPEDFNLGNIELQ